MKKITEILVLITTIISFNSQAIEIKQTKENKILLDLEDDTVEPDQKLYLLNASGKKIGIAQVIQVKNGKAIAIINKGTSRGATVVEIADGPIATNPDPDEDNSSSKKNKPLSSNNIYRLNSTKMSALLTLSMNSMNTKQTDGTLPTPNQETVPLAGTSFGITGAIDYPFKNILILRGTLGYEPFNASGSSNFLSCDNLTSRDCNANIQYISGGGYVRFNLTKSKNLFWAGLGMNGKFPLSKSTTALKSDDIKFTMTYALGFGLDYYTSNKTYLPFSFDYQIFLNSDTVSANIIMLRGGYGWAF